MSTSGQLVRTIWGPQDRRNRGESGPLTVPPANVDATSNLILIGGRGWYSGQGLLSLVPSMIRGPGTDTSG